MEQDRDIQLAASLVDLLRIRLRIHSDSAERGYTFLVDGEDEAVHLSYAGLDRRARAIGALLREHAAAGERVLLLYPPGLDYVAAFFGCLYGGAVAVPAYPPRLNRNLDRVRAIVADARPRIALLPAALLGRVAGWIEQAPELGDVQWLTSDGLEESLAESWRDPGVSPDSLAFLQYTSGSTGAPKGVMVSHGNLIHNSALIYRGFGLGPESRVCVWLPPFHDMGLIGGILQPLYAGVPATLMSPVAFLQRPARWLRAIARSGATVSGGPNFAYDLCVDKVTPEERRELDLSRWEVAFNGAEPVRAATLERFVAAFAECGLRREAFSPCYGLAEATLLVSCGTPGTPPVCRGFATAAAAADAEVRTLVASGRELPGQRIALVDPETLALVPAGRVGEIWVAGPSVAHGYWNRPEASHETFGARLASGEGPYLRTGDLGFLDGGDLFVTGRLKDLIVIRGRNHYPQDVEQTVEASHAALRRGCGAAFPVDAEGEERLVVVQEVERRARHAGAESWAEVFRAIRDAVLEAHGIAAWAVVLVGPGGVPKTSSGKIQRRACRELFLGDRLEPLASSLLAGGAAGGAGGIQAAAEADAAPALDLEPLLALPAERRGAALEARLRGEAARVLRLAPERLEADRPLAGYGLDSLTAMELKNTVESGLGLTLAPEDLLTGPSLAELTALILERLDTRSGFDRLPAIERQPSDEAIPLSFAQRRLWFLDQLAPGDPAYNIPGVVDLAGPLAPAALARALAEAVRRHEALRTTFATSTGVAGTDGEPVQRVGPPFVPELPVVDLAALPAEAARHEGERAAREIARRPFDLGRGPLLRAALIRGGASEHRLAATMHHTIADGWSLGLLAGEVAQLYGAFATGRPSPLPAPRLQYADFARWQHRWLGPALAGELAWWRERLAGASFALELPRDRPRPEQAGHRPGCRLPARLPPLPAAALAGLCRERGATPFMALLAAFAALLHRYTGQEDLCLGSPVANRGRSEIEGLIGCFVNTVVLRTDLSGDPAFDTLLARARETTIGALGHQDLPFERLAEALGRERGAGRQPLFEAMLALQTFPLAAAEAAGVRFAPRELDAGTAQFDLTLSLEPAGETWAGYLEYAADAIEAATAARLLAHFETLLAGALAEPERPLSELPLLAAAERRQLLEEWQGDRTGRAREQIEEDSAALVHELVAARARLTPEAPAVLGVEESLTYRELAERAGRLARALAGMGAGPEVVVGLCFRRSADLLVAMLAALEAGCAYLPLDPRHPGERLAWTIRDAGAPVVLTRGDTPLPETAAAVLDLSDLETASLAAEAAVPVRGPLPETPAYILYTSGSTGVPKGVVVPHRALARHAASVVEELRLGPSDRVLQLASAVFDVAAEEIFPTWIAGGAVVLASEAVAASPVDLSDFIGRQGLTVVNLPTPYWREWLALRTPDTGLPAPLRLVVVGSDTVPAESLAAWRELAGDVEWRNGYGVTEATVTSTFACLPGKGDEGGRVPIGCPLPHVEALVLDRRGNPAPAGAAGELHLGGGALARGYLNRPGLTAERFVPHPWRGPGARLYRTGDLARFRADGQLEFLGRADRQVKVRGVRVELGEIEAALLAHPAVREAAVVVSETELGDPRLVAWVETAAGEDIAGELRAHLRGRLPEAMVPQVFACVESLPRLPSGKLDRRGLAGRPLPAAALLLETAAPRTPVEEVLAALWAEMLEEATGGRRVGIDESFFDLGGHSLLATRLVARVRRAFGVDLGVRDLFEAPTAEALAHRVEEALRSGAGLDAPLLPRPEGAPPALSFAQERLWFLDQLEPGSARYNVPAAVRLAGRPRVAALERAFARVVERHEALRTTFHRDGGRPAAVISDPDYPEPSAAPRIPVVDLAGLPAAARRAAAAALAGGEARRPFDLARGPLLRLHLLRLGEEEHELLLCLHHIVCDGWSLGVLLRELGAAYAGGPLPELPVQYADYAAWQRALLQGEGLERRLAYWRQRLAGAPPVLELPSDRPRPPVQSERGGTVPAALPAGLAARLEALARERGATLFMVLLAGFQALLHRYSRQDDLCVGTPVANRGVAEVEGLIGFFANILVLRLDHTGDPGFAALVVRAREAALGAYAHQDLPFEQLVEDLRPRRDLAHAPLFQAMLALQNAPLPPLALPGLTLTPAGIDSGTSKYDLTLSLEETPRGLEGTLEYSRDLFDRSTAWRLLEHLERLLEAAAAEPEAPLSGLPLASAAERWQVLAEWNDTDAPAPAGTLAERFAAQAARSPDAPALVWGTEELSYQELAARADRLARHLAGLGAGPEVLVGVRLERTPELIVALLAILKAGAAYVPLDPRYPEERQSWILDDARARLLVTRGPAPADLPAETRAVRLEELDLDPEPESIPLAPAGLDSLAYVIYTSGSTGRPKGVAIEHRAAAAFLDWAAGVFPQRDLAGVLAATSVCFDLSVFEIFLPLTRGGTVVLAENALELPELPAAGRVTLVNTVPSVMAELADGGGIPASARTVNLAGEPLGRPLAQRLHRLPGVERLFNLYGPSEDTTYSTFARIEPDEAGAPAIGRPIAGTRAWLVDAALRPVPLGVSGELCLSGLGLARGYLGRPELTAERFAPDPFGGAGERMYRTGDLARCRADGSLEYLGRLDRQVKVRGFRIEPGEIEALLAEHPGVRESAVVAQRSPAGDLRLAAFVVPPAGAAPPATAELRAHLRSRLPEHMVPAAFAALPELPRMPNGKVDRRRLAENTAAGGERLSTPGVPPRTPVEETLAGLWRELLGGEAPGVHDDFFELGGHSLLAPRLAARIGEALAVELPVRALFEAPTIAGLAARIETALAVELPVPPVRPRPPGAPAPPLSFAQERFWFLDRLEPGSPHYNLPAALRLAGPLDVERLGRGLQDVARRHESLRTSFHDGGDDEGPVQVIAAEPDVPFAVVDLSGLPAGAGLALELAREEVRRPFDLSRGPLLRTLLLLLGAAEHVLVATLHHAVADGWSLGILVEELAVLYGALAAGRPSPLPPLPVQAADFALWQRERAAAGELDGQIDYWRRRLASPPPALDLPSDRPRPAVPSHGGGRVPVELEPALAAGLDALGRRRGATPFMTLLAAFGAVLSRRSGQLDFAVGSPVANRPRPEVEGVIGPLVNTLALRLDLAGEPSFLELLDAVRETALGAYTHQDLPFERLVQEVNPGRDLGRQPLFQVLFAWQSFRLAPASPAPGLDFVPFEVESGMAHFDLSLFLQPRGEGIAGSLEYGTDLFEPATAARIADQLRQALAAAVEDPARPAAELVMLSPEERRQLLLRPAAAAAGERPAEPRRRTLPRTPLEEMLAGVWAEVLGVREIGVHDSFFELGGHSLLAARVLSRLRRLLLVELPMRALFEAPTIAGLAERIEIEEASRQPGGAPLELIPLTPRDTPPPLSFAQRRLWFLDRLEPGSAAYNIPAALDLDGELDVPALAGALAGVVARHEALRTTFAEGADGQPVQVIAPAARQGLPLADLSGLPAAARGCAATEANRLAAAEAGRPFDLTRGPLLRAFLLRLDGRAHRAVLNVHHAVSDGWSMGVLVGELGALYAGEELPAPALQYADWAAWQRGWLHGEALAARLAFWRAHLAGAPPALTLPLDRPRRAMQTSRGASLTAVLPDVLVDRLRAASREAGATLFMTLLAAFQSLLGRHAAQDDVTVGTPVANRGRAEVEGVVGFFVNTLPLRLSLRAQEGEEPTLGELVARSRRAALDAYAHLDVPFELLVEELRPGRDLSHAPLFQVMLVLQNTPPAALALPGLTVTPREIDSGTAKFDLTLTLTETPAGLAGSWEHNRDLFDRSTIARLAERWQLLLASFADAPGLTLGEAPLLPEAERWQVLGEWNERGGERFHPGTLHGLFAAQAARSPEAVAVVHGEERWSYRRLDERAAGIAARLRRLGVGAGSETLVGVCLERTPDLIAALLGVMRAGGAYVPIDPAYPEERRRFLLRDAGAPVVVTETALLDRVDGCGARPLCVDLPGDEGHSWGPEPWDGGERHLAYVIYTSGSTGRPKGVAIEHRSAAALVAWAVERFTPAGLRGVLACTSVCFDLSVFEIFAPLACGGDVILAADPLALPGLPAAGEVRLVNTVPSAVAELVRGGGLPSSVRTVNLAGEPLPRELVERLYGLPGVERVLNLYGPSEDTTYSTCAQIEPGTGTPAIGRPLPGSRAYLLDRRLRPVPAGVPGELFLGGAGLARGYLGRPELTAERFVPDPFAAEPGERLYRTGDLARYHTGGELEFLGRIDHQVKLRGFRIELGEIEAVLRRHPVVAEAVALVREDRPGDPRLAAYVAAAEGITAPELRAFVRSRLPEFMVPAAFVVLPALPLTANGKVDRAALPAPDAANTPVETGAAAVPRGAVAEILAAIWCDVLGAGRAAAGDDFFALGGHSLLATQLVSRVRQTLGVDLPLRRLFDDPTFAGVLAAVDAAVLALRTGGPAPIPPIPPIPLVALPRDARPRLSHAQQRLWLLDRMQPGSAFYNLPMAVRAEGRVHVPALERSLEEIACRHEVLRTTFALQRHEPWQAVQPAAPVTLPVVDLAGLPEARRRLEARRLGDEEAQRPFDLARGPLWRAALLRQAGQEHELLLTMHHIVFDDWSMGVFLREMAALYEGFATGHPAALPAPPLQYADFARWQREWLEAGALAAQLDYWRRQLDGVEELRLPWDRPRTAATGSAGRHVAFTVPAGLARDLREASRRQGVTLFMTLMSAFAALLHRYSAQDDIALGSPIANRNRAEIEGLIGFFVNELVFRLDLAGNPTFRELLGRVREVALGAYAHQDASFDEVVAAVRPGRRRGQTPLVQVQFDLHNAPCGALRLPGLVLEPLEVERGAVQFDLQMSLTETEAELAGMLGYNTDLFDEMTIMRLLCHFEAILREVAADPERRLLDIPLGGESEALGDGFGAPPVDELESFNFGSGF